MGIQCVCASARVDHFNAIILRNGLYAARKQTRDVYVRGVNLSRELRIIN